MPSRHKIDRYWGMEPHARALRLEGKERQRAKREINEELKNQYINSESAIRDEARMERDEALAWACYERELADPTYRCTCFDD